MVGGGIYERLKRRTRNVWDEQLKGREEENLKKTESVGRIIVKDSKVVRHSEAFWFVGGGFIF